MSGRMIIHPGFGGGGDQLVWKVAAATSAAPTYFDPVQMGDSDSHVDGGVWGNNPAMVGITEAVHYAGKNLSEIRLLSIGTTSRPIRVRSHEEALAMGLRKWLGKGLDLVQGGASMATGNQARLLLGDSSYLRLDSERALRVRLDDIGQCRQLQEWGHDLGRRSGPSIGKLLGLDGSRMKSTRP